MERRVIVFHKPFFRAIFSVLLQWVQKKPKILAGRSSTCVRSNASTNNIVPDSFSAGQVFGREKTVQLDGQYGAGFPPKHHKAPHKVRRLFAHLC